MEDITREQVIVFAAIAASTPLNDGTNRELRSLATQVPVTNLCQLATRRAHERAIQAADAIPGLTPETVIIELDNGTQHHILRLSNKAGEQWVIDYTAHQYPTGLPSPIIATYLDWWTIMDDAINSADPQNGLDQEIGAYAEPIAG